MRFSSMAGVKVANAELGHHFFEKGTMDFFDSRVETDLVEGRYFVTSERFNEDSPRLYTIREVMPNGSINTVGEFQEYKSKLGALNEARALAEAEKIVERMEQEAI